MHENYTLMFLGCAVISFFGAIAAILLLVCLTQLPAEFRSPEKGGTPYHEKGYLFFFLFIFGLCAVGAPVIVMTNLGILHH